MPERIPPFVLFLVALGLDITLLGKARMEESYGLNNQVETNLRNGTIEWLRYVIL